LQAVMAGIISQHSGIFAFVRVARLSTQSCKSH